MNAPGPACIADFTGTVILANDYFKKVFHILTDIRDLKINIFSEDSPFSPVVKEIININEGIVSSAWKKITISPADGEKRNLIAITVDLCLTQIFPFKVYEFPERVFFYPEI